MADSIEQKLRDWLEEEGFPLELRTAREFTKAGWGFTHSRSYLDPDTDKEREIDLVAYFDDRSPVGLHGHLVVECKSSKGKPWVAFIGDRPALTPLGHLVGSPATPSLRSFIESRRNAEVTQLPLFRSVRESFNITPALARSNDSAFTAVMGASKAARDFSQALPGSILFVPVVVLEGRLFEAWLDDKGTLVVDEADRTWVLSHSMKQIHSVVHVVTESGLPRLIEDASTTIEMLRDLALQDPDRWSSSQREPRKRPN